MKLRLPHRLHAALVAALASVSFTTLCSGALTAAFFLGSQAFAEDSPEESMPDEPDQIAEFDIGNANLDDSPEESDAQQKILVDQASIKANEVGSNGVIGSSDGANQAAAMENGDDSPISFANEASPAQTVVTPGVAESNPADDLGFPTNQYATDTESNVSGVMSQVIANPAAVQVTDTQRQATPKTTSSSSTNKVSTLSVTSGLGSLGGGNSGSSLGVSSPVNATPVLLGAAATTVSTPTATNAAGWFVHKDGTWTFSGNYSGSQEAPATFSFNDAPGSSNKITFGDSGRAKYTFAVTLNTAALSVSQNTILFQGANMTGFGMKPDRSLTETWTTNATWRDTTFDLPKTGIITIVHSTGSAGSTFGVYNANGEQLFYTNEPTGLKGSPGVTEFTIAEILRSSLVSVAVWQTSDRLSESASLSAAAAMEYFPVSSDTFTWNGTSTSYAWSDPVWKTTEAGENVPFLNGGNAVFTEGEKTVSISSHVLARDVQMGGAYTFDVAESGSLSASSLSGSGSLTKTGSGTMTLNGGSSYSGSITVDGGTLVAASNNALGTASVKVTVNSGGTLELQTETGMPSISGTGTVRVTDGDFQYHNQNFLENFQGTVDITDGGLAQLGTVGNKFANATLKVSSGGTIKAWGGTFSHAILLAGGTLADAGGNETYSGFITLEANSTVEASNGKTVTLSGKVTGVHTLTTSGQGTVVLSGTDDLGDLNATARNTQISGTLTTDALTGTGPVNVQSRGKLTLTEEVGVITATLNVNEGGTLTLNRYGDSAVSVSGNLTIAGGSTLDLTSLVIDGGTSSYTLATGNITLNDGANFTLARGYEATDYMLQHTGNSLVLTFSPPEEVIWDNSTTDNMWTGSSNWHKEGATEQHVSFANGNKVRFTSDTSPAAPTLGADAIVSTMTLESGVGVTVGGAYKLTVNKIEGANASLTLNTASAQLNSAAVIGSLSGSAALTLAEGSSLTVDGAGESSYSGVISGSGSLTKNGEGTMTLSGNNSSFTGNITVNDGTLQMGNQNALGASNSTGVRTITIFDGGTIDIHGQDNTIYKYTLSGGSLVNNGNDTSSGHTQNAYIVLTADSSVGGTGKMSMIASGWGQTTANLGGRTLTKKDSGTFSFVNTDISKGTIQIDQGTVEFDTNYTHSRLEGDIKLNGGTFTGAVKMTADNAITAAVTSTASGNIELIQGHTTTLSAGDGVTMTLSGTVSGEGSLLKDGEGTVTLSGGNSYSGGTTVNAGTLVASNAAALGTGAVTVESGMLDLTTTVGTGSLTVDGGATLKLAGVNGLTVAGNLMLESGSYLDVSRITASESPVTLATVTGGSITASGVELLNVAESYKGELSVNGSDLVLTFTKLAPEALIWDNQQKDNSWTTSANWHKRDETDHGTSVFKAGDNVRFVSGFTNEPSITTNVQAGTVMVEADTKVTLENASLTADGLTIAADTKMTTVGTGDVTIHALEGAGDFVMSSNGTMALHGNNSGYSGTVTVAGAGSTLEVNASTYGGKLAQEDGGHITIYGNVDATIADANNRIEVVKKGDSALTLKSGSEKSIAKVTTAGANSAWMFAEGNFTNAEGLYTDIALNGSSGGQNGLILTQPNKTVNIGNLSGDSGNITIRGDWGNGGGRVLVLHQDQNTTFAGQFINSNERGIGLNKYGTGTITLTGANASTNALNVYEGAVELSGSGKWAGAANVHDGGTLRITSGGTNQTGAVTVNAGGTLDLRTDNTMTVTNDTAVFTVSGGTITNSGAGASTLDIETLNVGSNGGVVSGNVSFGTAADPMTRLHLENTLISKGDNAVYADEITFVGDLGESVGAGSTFKDSVSGSTANGYVVSAKVVLVENAAGTTLTTNLGDGQHTITHDGWTYTLQQDASSNIFISLMASTERTMQGDYYVNEGTLTYGASDNATGLESTNTLFVNGGALVFADTDLKTGVNLHVHKDGVVTLGEGRTLHEGAVHVKAGSTMTLDGKGTYALATATFEPKGGLPSGTVLKSGENGFTGMVLVGKDSVMVDTDLGGLANGTLSCVGFNGATGSLKIGEIAQNIYLQDYGSQVALSMNTGTDGESRTFTGAITGTGTLARSYVNGSGNIGGVQNYEFRGNLEGWTGVFDNEVEGAANTTNLTFSGNATVVNAEIKNGVAGSTGPLNVITTGSEGSVFNRSVTATSFTANGANATFNAALRLTGDASATGDAELVINNSATVDGRLSGDVEVTKSGHLTVAGAATLGGLTDNGIACFNGTVSASGAVTVGDGASLYLNNGGIALKDDATLTINSGSMVGLRGWTETSDTPTKSGVVTTGFTGGQLFSGSGDVTVATGSYFMKDGAKFLYSGEGAAGNRVRVHLVGENTGTVDVIEAIYYNVHTGDNKSMDDVKREAGEKALDYILIQSKGTLSGVTDENKGGYGISNSGLQGSGTIAVAKGGQLTDDASLTSFVGTITVGAGSTLVTDGTNTRTISVNGGTYKATDNVTLGSNVTFSGTGDAMPTIDVGEGDTVTMVKLQGEASRQTDLHKTGEGTLHLTDTSTTGNRTAVITGDMTIDGGTVVLTVHRHLNGASDGCGIVDGNITMAGGTDLVMEGFDALGNKDQGTKAKQIVMNAGTADNLTTLSFTRNGSDPETLQHTTLSTDIVMNGNTEMSGLRLNAYGTHNEGGLGGGAYIYAFGMNNTITNTFAMRENAYFEVYDASELVLLGNMELFDAGAESKKVIKTGTGVLDFAGENSTLHAIDIQAGTVEVTGNLTFTGPNANQFLMAEGAKFAVQNGATFNYREWLFENNDGTHAPGTVTAADRSKTYILEDANLVVSAMKLTNKNSGGQTINARLDGVQLIHTGGDVTINNTTAGPTQHIASLTVKTGETTLHSATLDAASVNPGATLSFSAGEKVELGSTILNGGTVNLAGTINVSNLSGFTPQKGAGFIDTKIHPDTPSDTYNGFYQGSTYYLIQEEAGDSTVSGAKNLALTYKGNSVTAFAQETGTNSYYFSVTEDSTLYYLNGEVGADTIYSENSTANRMYSGPDKNLHTTGIVMNAAGARLTLASDLRDDVRIIRAGSSGIEAKQNGTIDINSGVTLHQSDLSGDSGVRVALVGEGTFDLDGTSLKSVSSGLTDGSDAAWRGTVRASGTADNMNATMMGNVNSTLLLDGVKGTLTNADTRYVMKVELQNGNSALTDKALDNTFSTGAHRTFSNTVSGSGDILMTGESSDARQSIAFTGDVSGWKGTDEDAAMFETASQGTTNLAFSGGASEVNIVIQEGEGSTLNLSVGPTNALEGQTPAQVFNGDIKASSLTAEAGANTTLNNTTAISGIIDATADNAKLHVQGTTTAQTVQVGNGQVGINDTAGTAMVDVSGRSGTAVMDGGLELASGEKLATIKGTATGALSSVDGANVKVLSEAASLKLENLVLSDDTLVRGQGGNGNLIISGMVEQQLSTKNTGSKNDTTIKSALTMSGTTGTTMEYENGKVHNLDFNSMCQLARISGSAGTLVFDFTGMDGYNDWEHTFSAYGFIGVNFDPEVAMALKAANQQKEAIDASALTVKALTKDADGKLVERIGFYSNGGDGAVVGSVFYFQVPEPTTGTLSLLALAALAARRRRK